MTDHWLQQDSSGCPECGSGLSVDRQGSTARVSCAATDCLWTKYRVTTEHPYKDRSLNNDEIRSCATNCDHVTRKVSGGAMNTHPLNGLDYEAEAILCEDCNEVISNRPYRPVEYGLLGACPVCDRTVRENDDGTFSCTLCNWEGHLESCPEDSCDGGLHQTHNEQLGCTECNHEVSWREVADR